MRTGLEPRISQRDWKSAGIIAGNLSELTLTLGEVASAVQVGEESVELADKSEDTFQRMANRAILADALCQAGRWEESEAAFREAEAIQAERQPQYPRLSSPPGYRYCDLLLGLVFGRGAEPEDGSRLEGAGQAHEEIRERADEALEIVLRGSRNLLDIALNHLSLGRAQLGLALTSGASPDFTEAVKHLEQAVDVLRQSGSEHHLPRGLLARAVFRRRRGAADAAASDLAEAEEISERGHMRLHEADVHLEWTRLHLHREDRDSARRHLARAKELVAATGYGRREPEVAELERRLTG